MCYEINFGVLEIFTQKYEINNEKLTVFYIKTPKTMNLIVVFGVVFSVL